MKPAVPQHDFRATELDPDLLSTPFKAQTNWHVIAGAPSCGKTTLIDQLANHGFRTVTEPARLYIERVMAKGREIHPIHSNPAALQRKIREIQLSVECGLRATDALFLDGALPSCLAWYRLYGLDPNEILPECFYHRYACVFILDPLPFQPDHERIDELAADVSYIEERHIRDYRALGYDFVRVPALPPEERLAFVLKRLSERGLI